MSQLELIRFIGTTEIGVCAVLSNLFCLLYHVIAPTWHRNEIGRHIMSFAGVIAIILDIWIVGIWAGAENLFFNWLRLAAFTGLPYILARQIWLLIKVQGEGSRVSRIAREEIARHDTADPAE